ncbi:DUF378 domain-containing protein [Candidatus Woesebacteria bacterium]|jgi:uncharacterized membrane protein YuzA (DUF378 family)|nr:DUF378 domain-containing protein [Candidatus Woesebacteria bacterium]
MNGKSLHMITYPLMVIGALNWGLVGAFDMNLVNMLVGGYPMVETLVYVAVGLSALYDFLNHKATCKLCK